MYICIIYLQSSSSHPQEQASQQLHPRAHPHSRKCFQHSKKVHTRSTNFHSMALTNKNITINIDQYISYLFS